MQGLSMTMPLLRATFAITLPLFRATFDVYAPLLRATPRKGEPARPRPSASPPPPNHVKPAQGIK